MRLRVSVFRWMVAAALVLPAFAQVTTPAGKQDAAASASTQPEPIPALPVSVWQYAGRNVASVEVAGASGDDRAQLLATLKQKTGAPLDPEAVREDLRTLFATGRYRDIALSAETDASGLHLTYTGTARYFVGRVAVEGVKLDRLAQLVEYATKLEAGAAYKDSDLDAAVTSVRDALAQNGYREPQVSVMTKMDATNALIDFIFKVNTGPQARVGGVTVNGPDAGLTADEFRRAGHLDCSILVRSVRRNCRPKVNRETVSNALSGVRNKYQKANRLEGTIALDGQTYAQQRHQVDYAFTAHQGPEVRIIVDGTKLSRSRTKLLVPIFEEGTVDNDLLNEGAFNIRDYLQQKGYFSATVTYAVTNDGAARTSVTFTAVTGKLHKVEHIGVEGNKYFDTATIEERLRVRKGDAYSRYGRYSTQLVTADASSVLALYKANGFEHATVTPAVTEQDKTAGGAALKIAQIRVNYVISEGPQQKFGKVEVSGVNPERTAAVQGMLNAQTGQPYSLLTLSQDRDQLLTYYNANGFEKAFINVAQAVSDNDGTRTDVRFVIAEGPQVSVDKVLVSGRVHTKQSVVKSQLSVTPGQPLNQSALLETQRNLYNLALFNEVITAVENPQGDEDRKNVLVQLTEAKRWDVTYGFGFEAETGTPTNLGGRSGPSGSTGVSPRVSLDVTRSNLRGTQESLTTHGTYGLLERVVTTSYTIPQFLHRKTLTGQISWGYSDVQNITTFASTTLQADFRLSQKLRKANTLIYEFQYRRVSVDPNSLAITVNLIPQASEPVRVGGPQITYFHDTRSPSPLAATKGQYFSVQEFVASAAFGSESNFNKTDITHSSYYGFGKNKRYVLARNTRIGFEVPWGSNPNATTTQLGSTATACAGVLLTTNPACNAVPLPERLYAGGASSHRGFGINQAGPRDLTTGYPVGGNGVVVNTVELRLPPPVLPIVGDSVSFVLFHDMGNAFEYPSDMFTSFKNFRQPNQDSCKNVTVPSGVSQQNAVGSCNFNYYSHAVGVGLRYNTPVGPLRADFSVNLNPPVYPVFYDYTSSLPHVGQGGHFNFFFSIGQAF